MSFTGFESLIRHRWRPTLLAAALLQGPDLHAAEATPAAPLGGSQLQQIERSEAARDGPSPAPPAGLERTPPTAAAPAGPGADARGAVVQLPFALRVLLFHGARVFTRNELLALANFKPDMQTTVDGLLEMAARVTAAYRAKGYFIAQTYLPPQEIQDGVVTLEVMEGQYGQIRLRNSSALRDSTAQCLIAELRAGDVVQLQTLEEGLLLLTDVPGVRVQSSLAPGAQYGSSDLLIDVSPTPRWTGHLDADNEGNAYTGANRLGLSLHWNEPTGRGDAASLRLMTAGAGLNYERLAYQLQLGRSQLALAYTHMDYQLGSEFRSVEAKGESQTVGISNRYPLQRSRNRNLYLHAGYEDKTFQDRNIATRSDKQAWVWFAGLGGDYRSGAHPGAAPSAETLAGYSLRWVHGALNLQSALDRASDALAAQTMGRYDKLEYNVNWLQPLSATVSAYATLNGQQAFKNLDASEKIALGGAAGVRAYPVGEASADSGYVLNLELRKNAHGDDSQWQFLGFVDTGVAHTSTSPWATAAGSAAQRTLSAAGVGLNWIGAHKLTLKAFVAWKLGTEAATSAADAPARGWVQIIQYF